MGALGGGIRGLGASHCPSLWTQGQEESWDPPSKMWGVQGGHLQLIQAELAVLAPRPFAVGEDPASAHHDGA